MDGCLDSLGVCGSWELSLIRVLRHACRLLSNNEVMRHACGLLSSNLIREIRNLGVWGGGIWELRNSTWELHL
jgi:hypothetical protein